MAREKKLGVGIDALSALKALVDAAVEQSQRPAPLRKRATDPTKSSQIPDDPKWKDIRKTCPHCGKMKAIDPGFGVRNVRGDFRPHSWCQTCRSTTNYYKRPRKYVSQG